MTITDELRHVTQLLFQGRLIAALSEVEELEKKVKQKDIITTVKLLKCKILIKLENIEGALGLADQSLKLSKKTNNEIQVLDAIILKTETLWRLGNYNESFKMIEKGKQLLGTITQAQESLTREVSLIYNEANILFLKGDVEEALKLGQKGLNLQQNKVGNEHSIAEFLTFLGVIYWNQGQFDRALDQFRKSFSIFGKLKDQRGIGINLSNIGSVYQERGNLDLALEYKQNAIQILEEVGDQRNFAITLQNIGEIYTSKGELSLAFEYAQRSLAIFEELDSKHSIAESLFFIGDIFKTKGDLDSALEFYDKSLILYQEIGRPGALPLASIGEIFHAKEKFELALEKYKQSLDSFEKMGYELIETKNLYYNLIRLSIDTNALDQAKEYIQQIQKINEKGDNVVLNQICRVAEALLLKTSKRITNLAKAQRLLQQVAKEKIVFFELTVDAILNLCDLLLGELRTFGNEEVLNEVKTWSNKLLELAQKQHSFSLLAETYLLQSRLALLELDIQQAQTLLDKAKILTEENELHQLHTKILDEQFFLHEQSNKWERLAGKELSIKERINLIQLEDLLDRMIHKRIFQKQEEIIDYAAEASALVEKWEKEEG
ncbi:MAG: tetratricopeptide repeat protein [Candidatus Heimdallarchaeota archaeon]|nr:MAG: tetratricopeptide repeat protein [Candidatus Heimdallarchaeota archaeon]